MGGFVQDSPQNNDDFVDLVSGPEGLPQVEPGAEDEDRTEFSDMVRESSSEDLTHGDFTVTVNKSGDAVESIDVTCQCGKKTRILLDYQG